MKPHIALTAALFCMPLLSVAATTSWKVDSHATTAVLSLSHSEMLDYYFLFPDISGAAELDLYNFTDSSIRFEIHPAKILTSFAEVGDKLIGPDLLHASAYPDIAFHSEQIQHSGNGFKMQGLLSMHGVSKPVTFEVEPLRRVAESRGTHFRGLTAHTTINRRDFGMTYRDSDRPASAAQQYGDEWRLTVVLELTDRSDQIESLNKR
ncbi:MAG: YceI family protein [Steroidobacteraceae bacterium]